MLEMMLQSEVQATLMSSRGWNIEERYETSKISTKDKAITVGTRAAAIESINDEVPKLN